MRRWGLLVLLLLTYYLAGMYRSLPLLALCLGEILLAAGAFFQSWRLCRGISVRFPREMETVTLGNETRCAIQIADISHREPFRCRVTLEASYPGQAPTRTKLKGSGETLEFSVSAPLCGLLCLRLVMVEVRDCFGLFRSKKPLDAQLELAVFPAGEMLSIIPVGLEDGSSAGAQLSPLCGEGGEVRQLREYRAGDQLRHIHWNLSARTGKLLLKELENEQAQTVRLFLRQEEEATHSPEGWSGFFRLLSAVVLGLLSHLAGVRVCWRDKTGQLCQEEVTCPDDCRRLLLTLYRLTETGLLVSCPAPEDQKNSFLLDTGLGWYWEGRLIFCFSPDRLGQEIREETFSL